MKKVIIVGVNPKISSLESYKYIEEIKKLNTKVEICITNDISESNILEISKMYNADVANIVVLEDMIPKQIEIDGIKYQEIKEKKELNLITPFEYNDKKDLVKELLTKINLVDEYTLICRKQCKLSKNEREIVVIEFNKKYKKV